MMKRVHFEEALRSRLDRQPFQPFAIEMEDGRHFEIRKKKDLAYWVGDTAMYGEPGNGWEWLNRDDVERIVDLATEAPA
jgi:hypothetical protein